MTVSIHDLLTNPPSGTTAFELLRELDKSGAEPRKEDGAVVLKLVRDRLPQAPKAETGPAEHSFYAVAGLIDYVAKFGSESVLILANPAAMTVGVILDERIPAGGREVLTLRPQIHPRWFPWRNLLDKKIPLEDFLRHVRKNLRTISGDGRALVFTLSQVTCATTKTLHKGSGRDALNGITIRTKITGGQEGQPEHLALPDSISLWTNVFVDQPKRTIEVDLILQASRDGNDLTVELASADVEEAEIRAFEEIVDQLRERFGDDPSVTVAFGKPSQGRWERVT